MQANQSENLKQHHISALQSYCQVCYIPFEKVPARKIDQGLECLFCIKCKCRVHKCCYDLEVNSNFISPQIRQFVCQRCEQRQTMNKGCIICHKKDGVMKVVSGNKVVHVFCGLMHRDINVITYYPEIKFKLGQQYKQSEEKCNICHKNNATEKCALETCNKKYHGYCVLHQLKIKEAEEDEPICQKYYFSSGDNGSFDLTKQRLSKNWVYEQFDKLLKSFEQFGFSIKSKNELKEKVYKEYEQSQKSQGDSQSNLRRGGFAYVLCDQHQTSIYCNCLNRRDGDPLVQCQCCFQWYHYKCVNYSPEKDSGHFICPYCQKFYDLKKKIIDEVKNSKNQHYELNFDSPKLHLSDYLWLMRVIDCRIAGGAAGKMMKELIKYPLKTSKMDLIIRSQNRKKITNLSDQFIEAYIESEDHKELLNPKIVLDLDSDQKPITIAENVKYNRNLREYIEFIHSYTRKNNIKFPFGAVMQKLKFKERATEEDYEVISELIRGDHQEPEMKVLRVKMDAYSFMEILKDINSGSMISFEDLEQAVKKAKLSTSVPSYLLRPLIQRYEKVKNLVQLVSKNIHQYKETSQDIENAVRQLGEDKVFPPKIYQSFHAQRRLVKNLYLLYLKQEGKPFQEGLQTADKIRILNESPLCKPSHELASLLNDFSNDYLGEPIHPGIDELFQKYMKIIIMFEIKDALKKKNLSIKVLDQLVFKSENYSVSEEDLEISGLVNDWVKIKKSWEQINESYDKQIMDIDDIIDLGNLSRQIEEVLKNINDLPIIINNNNQQLENLGSIQGLNKKRENLKILLILVTQSQLKKNPMTIADIPISIPRQNPLIKNYNALKKQQNTLLTKYKWYYDRIKEKISLLRNDSKKQRKQQIRENLQKPKLSDIYDFIETLKNSKVSMQLQIKQLTKTVNNSLDIASKVTKFMAEQNHIQDIFNEQHLNKLKRQIQELRKRLLNEAQICLDSELKELYQSELCLRMQMMIVSSHVELDKMNKLLKFAEEEGLQHMGIYRRLKSKFEVGNQTSKQFNLFKKNESSLRSEAQKQMNHKQPYYFYRNLSNFRKSLNLGIAKPMKQKSSHVDALINRNSFLKNKIQMILMQQPKKYEYQEIKSIYFEALKHPFQIQGFAKLIGQIQKLDRVYRQWKAVRNYQTSYCSVFIDYQALSVGIQQVDNNLKAIKQCQMTIKQIKELADEKCTVESLYKIQDLIEVIEGSHIQKTSEMYFNARAEYFNFWISLIKKIQHQKSQLIPYCKIRSLAYEVYHTFQKCLKNGVKNESYRPIIMFFEGLLGRIKKFCNLKTPEQNIFEGFIDIEDLKLELSEGLNINEQIVILNPYIDISKFLNLDLLKALNKQHQQITIKRQRSDNNIEGEQGYKIPQKLTYKNKSQMEADDEDDQWDNTLSNKVTDNQRTKIKQILLKNIKKNSVLATNIQNLEQQVKLIENQLFGQFHNDIVKYLEISNSFEKLFIKLINFPNISARVAKKKLQWSFLKLLMESKDKFSDVQKALSTQSAKQQKQTKKQQQQQKKQQKRQEPPKKQKKNIEEMIASGKLDQQVRRQFKKQIKAIRDSRHKKKKHKKRRSRSRSRSPDARFSSESSQQMQKSAKPLIYQQQIKPIFTQYPQRTNQQHFMFDPDQQQNSHPQQKINYPRGTPLKIKTVDVEFTLHKNSREKINLKSLKMMSNQDYKKIVGELVDPNFNNIQIRKDKSDHEIIAHLSKPSRKKYKFLYGWFESDKDEENQLIRDFSIQINDKKRIFGIQNQHMKMHIMSIRQYLRIARLQDPNQAVTSESASKYLNQDRLVFILQYPSQRMYELKGVYQNFKNIQAFQQTYPVSIPELAPIIHDIPQASMGYMDHFNPQHMLPHQMNMGQYNQIKQVQLEGWGNTAEPSINYSSSNYVPPAPAPYNPQQTHGMSSILSRFSPILTDEEENNNNNQNQEYKKSAQKQGQVDLASNILNSLADIDFKDSDFNNLSKNKYDETNLAQDKNYQQFRYPQMPPTNPMQHQSSNPMQANRWVPPQYAQQYGRPYTNPMAMSNPMSGNRYAPPPNSGRMGPIGNQMMMYKNPMMGGNYQIPAPPPPPAQSDKKYSANQYDPYQYQKRQ